MNYPTWLTTHAHYTNAGRRHGPPKLLVAMALAVAFSLLPALMPGGISQAYAQETTTPPAVAAVNINKADAATLASGLSGVGASRAEEIVRYRETFGPFKSVDELTEVKGIGKSTLDENRARITLE